MIPRILKIINSSLTFILLTHVAEVLYGTISYQPLIFLNIIIFPFLKCYILSGICGSIAEIASNENIVFRREYFFRNAHKYWILLLIFSLCPFAVYFVSFITIGIFDIIPFDITYAMFSLIIYYLLSFFIIREKYLRILNIAPRKFRLSTKNIIFLTSIYLLNIACVNIAITTELLNPLVLNILNFCSLYLQILMFSYFTVLILDHYPEIYDHNEPAKELFLINPLNGGILSGLSYKLAQLNPPPVFAIFKALTPKNYKIREFNLLFWRKRYFKKNKLIAITCFTSNAFEAYALAKGFKEAGSTVIMGGPHVSFLPDEALNYCDSVVICDVEAVWLDIIKDYENNDLKKKYFKPASEEDHHKVNTALLNLSPRNISGYLETTRGCKFHCDFCAVPVLSNRTIYKRPLEDIIALIKKVKTKYKRLSFIDPNLFSDPTYAKKLFIELKKLNVEWGMQSSIDIAKDDEALKLAKESGCFSMLFGYEIIADSKEKEKKGKFLMADKYLELSNKVKKYGIRIKAHFILGFENDTLKSIFNIWKFSRAIMPWFSSISLLTPLPGTKFYSKMSEENRLTNLNWRRYCLSHMVFKHKNLKNATLSYVYPLAYCFINLTASKGGQTISLLSLFSIILLTIVSKYYFILPNIK